MEEDDLAVDILNENEEHLGTTVYLLLPVEIGDNGQVNTQEGMSDRLYLRLQPRNFSQDHAQCNEK